MDRRQLLAGGLAASALGALPARVRAQAWSITEQHRRVLAVAAEQLERHRAGLWRTDLVGIADFALPSSLPRFHFANLEQGTVRSFLVAHGKGSDPEHDGFLKTFSNVPNSLATSRGAYVTYEWYKGRYGTSIRLGGIEADNSNALDRAIVLHPAWYANPAMLEKWGKLGRSDGCFAMAEDDFNEALWHLSGGRLIYADKLGLG
ncbi:murein L,D-transpeptidase catalytic domain family protein [Novosphingobium flavum]|uniref:Murein L,D-transpeptidase catalytic domain family protein n=1 Tax=Novosphingobium aerophilum TaxID=2839843 RepID=A0A7X1F7A6_9SPHN|nr:murein L,D-transpeptidase catalytic domain family protein [Novosphingobium aerophilum]MBC2651374.1 murein L,D-transpeptidase catalytic domain family protein [Novosphingobium aerophilum]MBC2661174.1 murein L,D-transpeptidase catalytic domain family protein [Novosphingobium aerophilum]